MKRKYLAIILMMVIVTSLGCVEDIRQKSGSREKNIETIKLTTPVATESSSRDIEKVNITVLSKSLEIDNASNKEKVLVRIDSSKIGRLSYIEKYYSRDDTGTLKLDSAILYYNDTISDNTLTIKIQRPLDESGNSYRLVEASIFINNKKEFDTWFKFDDKKEKSPISSLVNKVLVEHYEKNVSKLTKYVLSDGPEYQYPSPGMTFLVINLKITNQGYSMIKINKFQWNLKINTKYNPNSYVEADKIFSGEKDGIECKETELENKGWILCKIPFEVPKNYDQYKIFWSEDNSVNIEWKYTPTTANEQTVVETTSPTYQPTAEETTNIYTPNPIYTVDNTPVPTSIENPEIKVLNNNEYTDIIDNYKVVGEVQNTINSNIKYVKVIGTFYDPKNTVIATDYTYIDIDILIPGQKSPFEINAGKVTPSSYRLTVSYDTTIDQPYRDFKILSQSSKTDEIGYYRIVGEVKNTGSKNAKYVKVIASYYNSNGGIIGKSYSYTNPEEITAGNVAPFELSAKLNPSKYEIQIEGQGQ